LLLRVLSEHGKHHPSFLEVCKALWKHQPSVSQSTILKNLATFEGIGIVRSFSFRGETHYEVNPTPHVNLADATKGIVDVQDDEIEQILEELIRKVKERTGVEAKNLLVMIE
jgi:Fe2+ or Zn2+ uptake regulation protein